MNRVFNYYVFIAILFLVSSCSIPHLFYSSSNILYNDYIHSVEVSEWHRPFACKNSNNKHFVISFSFPSVSSIEVSEKSFLVLHGNKRIHPKVSVKNGNSIKRIKKTSTLPPSSMISISFNTKREPGDTIRIKGNNISEKADSVIINIFVPEDL